MVPQQSIIAEIESAISSGSAEKRVDTLRRVTDLFLLGSEGFSDPQVELFDDVIARLAERIEVAARVELARRLAPVSNAPSNVVRALARDRSFDVAGPVLSQSSRLTEEDLLEFANGGSQDRLLAISRRASISEAVSDVLVTRGDREVVRSVASNEGARFSNATFGKLVEKSQADDELAVSVGMRKDIPREQFHALVAKASEAVFKRLAAHNPAAAGEVNRVLFDLTGHKAAHAQKVKRDYKDALALIDLIQRAGKPIDLSVRDFARSGKFEETVAALAVICKLPVEAVERILSDQRANNELALILAKAAGMSWQTAKLILQNGRGDAAISVQASETLRQHFERLQMATAQRVVRFYQVRYAATGKAN